MEQRESIDVGRDNAGRPWFVVTLVSDYGRVRRTVTVQDERWGLDALLKEIACGKTDVTCLAADAGAVFRDEDGDAVSRWADDSRKKHLWATFETGVIVGMEAARIEFGFPDDHGERTLGPADVNAISLAVEPRKQRASGGYDRGVSSLLVDEASCGEVEQTLAVTMPITRAECRVLTKHWLSHALRLDHRESQADLTVAERRHGVFCWDRAGEFATAGDHEFFRLVDEVLEELCIRPEELWYHPSSRQFGLRRTDTQSNEVQVSSRSRTAREQLPWSNSHPG